VSAGHGIDLESAAAWTLRAARGYRLPEPTRQAHMLVNAYRRAAGQVARGAALGAVTSVMNR
jgi:deoxyribonuclease V